MYVRIIYIYISVCVCAYNQACQVSQKSLLHAGRCLNDLPCQESWRCRLRKRSTNSTSCWDSEAPRLLEDFPSTSSFAPSKAGEPPCFPKSLGWAESTWDLLPFSTRLVHVCVYLSWGKDGKRNTASLKPYPPFLPFLLFNKPSMQPTEPPTISPPAGPLQL